MKKKNLFSLLALLMCSVGTWAQGELIDYLAFKAVGGDVTVGTMSLHPSATPYSLEYSTDRVSWEQVNVDISMREGDVIFFRSGYEDVKSSMDLTKFTMSSDDDGMIEASGNIMSLLDKTCASTIVGDNGFQYLFYGCDLLTTAPKLPATTVGESSYFAMFLGCTHLNSDVVLPAKTMVKDCYKSMFSGCSSMSSNIIIQSMRLNDYPLSFCENWLKGTAGVKVFVAFSNENHTGSAIRAEGGFVTFGGYSETAEYSDDIFNFNVYQNKSYDEFLVDNFVIDRSMTNDGWYTICLPFDVKIEDTPFSAAAEYIDLEGNVFKFSSVSELKAGVGYIVKVDNEVSKLEFTNVVIPSMLYPNKDKAFRGTFETVNLVNDYQSNFYVIGTGSSVNPISGAGTLKGFRAYFFFREKPFVSDAKPFYFSVDDEEVTSVSRIDSDINSSEAIYNLQGQRVNASHRGIVIKKGKKTLK